MVLSDECAQISVLRRSVFDRGSSDHEAAPLGQGGRAERFVGRSIDEVAFGIEVVLDVGVDGGELLQRLHSSKSEHRPFSSSEGKVAVLGSIVGVPTDLLLLRIATVVHRSPIGFQPVGDD